MHLQNLTQWRQLTYRLFSSLLLYPDEERLETIATAAAALREQSSSTVMFAFFPQWQRLLVSLADLPDHHTLGGEYVRVFMHSPQGTPCLPYESAYVDPGRQTTGWLVALLEQEYSAAGLDLSPLLKDLPDHAAVELEFMSFLCGQEADAWNREIIKDGVQTLERQAAFLDRHLTRWFPEWAQQVAAADDEGIYAVVTETAQAFVNHDQGLICGLLDRFQKVPKAAQTGVKGRVAVEKQ